MIKKQIRNVDAYQTAKVLAIMYGIVTSIIFLPLGVFVLLIGGDSMGIPRISGLFFFVLPFVYGFITFLLFGLMGMLYNFFASKVGGIVIEVKDEPLD